MKDTPDNKVKGESMPINFNKSHRPFITALEGKPTDGYRKAVDTPDTTSELREQINDIFARACKNNEYFGRDGWYELHTPTVRAEIQELIQSHTNKARIDEIKERDIESRIVGMHELVATFQFEDIPLNAKQKESYRQYVRHLEAQLQSNKEKQV